VTRGRSTGIIVACTVVIIVAVVLAVIRPWERTPSVETCTLTTTVDPSGAGSVSPSGGEYESGVQVTLTANPASGYSFDHWDGDASNGSATISIIMDSDKNVTAYFEEEPAATSIPITFTGSSETATPLFAVTTSEWVISWSYVPDYDFPGSASFGLFVHPRGDEADYVESVFLPKTTEGSIYSYAGPGEYYIEVLCGNVESWRIGIRPP
jgi:hypothetical protein